MIFNLNDSNLDALVDALSELKGEYVVTVKRRRKIRSLSQNKYYWGVVVKVIGEYLGETKERVHDMLAALYLRDTIDLKNGNTELTVKSTAKLTTDEFEVYLKQVRQWAQEELSCVIPEPNEVTNEVWERIQAEYDKMFY